ncbi:MAG TPA: hypothetical protein VGG06_23865 [Thermoanaerobaculia bacterium]|jgi:hypothetical protein
MTTFDVTEWCDFVRGVAAPEAEREMREQLAAGDARARGTVEFLTRVMAVARTDQETELPEYALRTVKAIAAVQRHADAPAVSTPWRFLPVEITFDSLLEPAHAGTRDLQPAFRQLSFKAEGYSVDLRLEADAGSRRAALVGQVLETRAERRPVARVPVLVTAGGRIVARSLTSRFGEFHAEELPRERLDLFVLVGPETCVAVPLEQAADD